MRWFEIPLAAGAPLLLDDEDETEEELLEDDEEDIELDALLRSLDTDGAAGVGGLGGVGVGAGAGVGAGGASWLSLGSPCLRTNLFQPSSS